MNLTARAIVRHTALGLALTFAAGGYALVQAVASATPAWAPQMVANELAAQRALGWEPCEPVLKQIPADETDDGAIYAEAGGTDPGQECQVRFAAHVPVEALEWVAWHEVCHLSTLTAIYDDPHRPIVDPAHDHALFQACISQGPAEHGGYLF